MNGLDLEENDIPPELKCVAVTQFSFYKIRDHLETQQYPGKLLKCVVLFTKLNDFVELEDGVIKRIERLDIASPTKLVIHHEFLPFRRFIVILTARNSAHLLDFRNLKLVSKWDEVKDVTSTDLMECGRPNLILIKVSGKNLTLSKENFIVGRGSPVEQEEDCRSEAVTALNNKVKSIMCLAETLEVERFRKERFICQKISSFADQLQRNPADTNQSIHMEDLSSKCATTSKDISMPSSTRNGDHEEKPVVKVLFARQRIIHNKWVIFVSVLNQSERYVIRNPDLILHSGEVSTFLRFETRLFKLFQRVSKKGKLSSSEGSDVNVQTIHPPILGPKKKAFLLAICDFPDFYPMETISCNGVITFVIESSKAAPGYENKRISQITFPSVHLSARNLTSVCASVTREQGSLGLPLDIFALIATSVTYTFTINSRATPLGQVIEAMSKDKRIVKVPYLNGLYCFNTIECHPLHFAAFICRPLAATKLLLTTYTKDDKQGMLLIHNIKAMLPCDATFISGDHESQGELFSLNSAKTLLSKMHLVVSQIQGAFSDRRDDTTLTQKRHRSDPETSVVTTEFNNRWKETDYLAWRHNIVVLGLEIEFLFRQSNIK